MKLTRIGFAVAAFAVTFTATFTATLTATLTPTLAQAQTTSRTGAAGIIQAAATKVYIV